MISLRHIICIFTIIASGLMPPSPHARFIVITELMRNPAGGASDCPGDKCHEYIEIFNAGADTFPFDSLFLSNGSSTDSILPWPTPMGTHPRCLYGRSSLPPGQAAVILDPDYAASPLLPIADSTVLLTVNHVSILGGLTDTRGVLLYKGTRDRTRFDPVAAAVDPGQDVAGSSLSLALPAGAREGFSLVPVYALFQPARYQPNPDTLDPGTWSAVNNGWIIEYRLRQPAAADTAVVCTVGIMRIGAAAASQAEWTVRAARTGAIIAHGSVAAAPRPYFFTAAIPKDSAAYLISAGDNSHSAEKRIDLSTVWLSGTPVKISEISPRASPAVPEWFEVVNVSTMAVNLKHWRFGAAEPADTISVSDCLLEPSAYLVITADRALFAKAFPAITAVIEPPRWHALDNYRDTMHLWSPFSSSPCETIYYDSKWFESWDKQSLERVGYDGDGVSAAQWALAALPSPGQPNRSTAWRLIARPRMDIGPVPFTPNGDGKDDLLCIRFALPAGATASAHIYGFNGDLLRHIPEPIGEKNFWDGRTDNGTDAAVGPFFVIAEIRQNGRKEKIRMKGILWR